MPRRRKPREGSLQFWPRKRAKRIYSRVSSWPAVKDNVLLGFAGYKAGMTHVSIDVQGKKITKPVTVIDAPSLLVCGLRFYAKTSSIPAGLYVLGEKWIPKISKDLQRKIKNAGKKFDETKINDATDVRLIVCTQPGKSGMHKIKPELFEMAVGGQDIKKKIDYANTLLSKEINAKDVLKPGEYVDVSAVTKGYGFTGPVKRYGIKVQGRKNEQHQRHVGSTGSETPRKMDWRTPAAGQYGFFNRTEINKRIMMIGDDSKKINPKGGFVGYGIIPSAYILIEGSVGGHRKRLVRIRKAMRATKHQAPVDIKYVSLESKQN